MKGQQVHYIHGEDGVTLTPCKCAQKRGFDFLSLISADFSVFIFAISYR